MKILRFLGEGVGHSDRGKPCQDRLSAVVAENGTAIFAVSDGCSSSKYGGEAAQVNIDVVNNIFSQLRIKDLSVESLLGLYPYLAESKDRPETDIDCLGCIFAHEQGILLKRLSKNDKDVISSDFCATLLFAIVEQDRTLVGHIGDGNIIFYDGNGETVFHSEPENGSSSSRTFFTLSKDFVEHFFLREISTDSYKSMIMSSDGTQSMFSLEGNHAVEKAAYELAVKPVAEGTVHSDKEFAELLHVPLSRAMHYNYDDISVITMCKCTEVFSPLDITPLKKRFMEEFDKRRAELQKNNDQEDDSTANLLSGEAENADKVSAESSREGNERSETAAARERSGENGQYFGGWQPGDATERFVPNFAVIEDFEDEPSGEDLTPYKKEIETVKKNLSKNRTKKKRKKEDNTDE